MGQTLDCDNATSQAEMTGCASMAYDAADAELNRQWKRAMAAMKQMDRYSPNAQPSGEDVLRQAQRAWIAFRDPACEAESYLARGGTMQNQLFYVCLERLSRQRAEDLRLIADGLN
ncbi:lysozyme inhibitor LprI family protein [Pseudoprimorskyibacter insulae]|nr:lysozyme inhibitor LprI family protein [Pseudoprimorskyibacter insulae]